MNTRIKSTDYKITPETRKYLDVRLVALEKLLGKDAELARCDVEVGRDTGHRRHGEHVWFAEITLVVPGGVHARATNRGSTINEAIDDVKEEVERQLRKAKKSKITRTREGGARAKRFLKDAQ